MSFFEDDEILEDFLVEAGEILEQLSEQLVALERQPGDMELLNAIFRGFHTVKGGAGFLQLLPLVDCCHVTENLFDQLRNGQRQVTPELMDTVLQALDTVMEMFTAIKERRPLTAADPALMQALNDLVAGLDQTATGSQEPSADKEPSASQEPSANKEPSASQEPSADKVPSADKEPSADKKPSASRKPSAAPPDDEMTDEEFEELLAALDSADFAAEAESQTPAGQADHSAHTGESERKQNRSNPAGNISDRGDDEITEAEFEALLDQLRDGAGVDAGLPSTENSAPASAQSEHSGDGDMTDDEFESLLDELHGSGKHGGMPAVSRVDSAPAATVAAPSHATEAKSTPPPPNPSAPAGPGASAPLKPEPSATREASVETTVRVDTRRLDDIMNMVGELVLVRNRLVRIGSSSTDELLSKTIANLDLVTADLQTSVMKTRMQPIRKVFGRFPRLVRDLARNLDKEVLLELRGEDTDLDKNLVEALADPLIHLVRNAIDHGIEQPDVRERDGKPRQGRILLSAEQEGDHILLIISDDGNGMDPEVLRRKAVEKGIMDSDAANRLTRRECFELIFAPGFSTRTEVSDVSGRGVGMDVVKTKISQLNGSVVIDSSPGKGSQIDIKVPLTLAIMPTLMIMLANQTFALPLASVSEIFNINLNQTHVVDGRQVVTVRDKALPLFHLRDWLTAAPEAVNDASMEANVVVVTVGAQRVGFVVDSLIGQEEVVIKPLGRMLHGTPGMAGATITGDGGIAIILDIPGLLKQYAA